MLGTDHIVSIAYSKEEQGIVERGNQEVIRWMRIMLHEKKMSKDKWSRFLPFVQRLHNASKIESIGFAPCEIIFGDRVMLDRNILLPRNLMADPEDRTISEYMADTRKMQDEVLLAAQRITADRERRTLESRFEDDVVFTEFETGSHVLLAYPRTDFGQRRPTKLHLLRRGPYEVMGHEGNLYTIKHSATGEIEHKLIFLLRPYYFDKTRTNPKDKALHDTHDGFWVEKILSHTGTYKRRGQMTFRVKWIGYEELTTEPWSNMRKNDVCGEYMYDKLGIDIKAENLKETAQRTERKRPVRVEPMEEDTDAMDVPQEGTIQPVAIQGSVTRRSAKKFATGKT